MDYSATSKIALKWAIDNLIGAGDTVVVLLVLSAKSDPANKQLFADTGSPLIPLAEFKETGVCKKYGITPDSELFNMLDTVFATKKAQVVAKVYWGDPREKLCEAVNHLKLDAIVVGSRGLGTLKRPKSRRLLQIYGPSTSPIANCRLQINGLVVFKIWNTILEIKKRRRLQRIIRL